MLAMAEVIYEPFISLKEQPAYFQCQKVEVFDSLVLAPHPLLYYPNICLRLVGASTNFFLDKQN